MTNLLSTRLSNASVPIHSEGTAPCLLVRIYPVATVEQPLELGKETLLVGRDTSCTLVLSDGSVSRRHAMIESFDGYHLVSDLGSKNGTHVNDQLLNEPRILQAGDRVGFGNHVFKYVASDKIEAQFHEFLHQLMTTDCLTSVRNKRFFLEALKREHDALRETESPFCVLMMDLDKFKLVNDTYGHIAGDAVLVEFAKRAQSVTRDRDLLARYGGEEFALLMPKTTLLEGAKLAEEIRKITAATAFRYEENDIPVTVSLGLSCSAGKTGRQADDVLAQADIQLYEAKNSGRNQVRFKSENNVPQEMTDFRLTAFSTR